MRNKTKFIPDPEINKNTLVIPSELAVYESSVEGAITFTMSRKGVIQAGTRLTRFQVAGLATTLINLLGEQDVDPFTLGQDAGYVAGYRDGHNDGYHEGFNAGWDDCFEEQTA